MLTRAHAMLERLLRRETSDGRFVPEVDGLRFFAFFAVLVFHVHGYYSVHAAADPAHFTPPLPGNLLAALAGRGGLGVQMFFAISGFILALPFGRHYLLGAKAVSLRAYFARRVTRLEPPYILFLLFMYAAAIAFRHADALHTLPHLIASVFYVHGLAYHDVPLGSLGWSLEIEVQFYILAPLLARVFAVRPAGLRRGILLAALLAAGAVPLVLPRVADFKFLPGHFQYFIAGFILVELYCVEFQGPPLRPAAWDAAAALASVAFGWAAVNLPERWWGLALPAPLVILYAAAFRGRLWRAIVSNPWLYLVGGMCYTLYLYHFFVVTGVGKLTTRLPRSGRYAIDLPVQVVLLGGLSVAAGVPLFLLFEKPFMRRDWPGRLARWLGGRTARSPLTQPAGDLRRI